MADIDAPHRLVPHIVCAGANSAIDFYKAAFDAKEMIRLNAPNGQLAHGSISINGGMVMLVDENVGMGMAGPKHLGGTSVTFHLSVDDADAAIAKAVAAGARVIMPVAEQFWGDRYGVIEDPFGHRWSIATPGKNAPRTNEALLEAMKKAGPMPPSARK